MVGIVALIVFGPRKLPQMARKAGGFMRELRSVSNDFKSTWTEEVRLAEEKEGLNEGTNDENSILPESVVNKEASSHSDNKKDNILPEVREVSKEDFQKLVEEGKKDREVSESDKESWI